MKARSIWGVGAALVAGVVAVSAYLGYQYVSAQVNEDHAAPDLTLGGRTEFKICVDRVGIDGSSVGPSDVTVVQGALGQALAAVAALPPKYQGSAMLVQGCPEPRLLFTERVSYRERNSPQRGQVVGSSSGPVAPSPYRVFVYFTEPGAYAASFGSEPYATTTEEYDCQSGICFAVTRALYVPYDNVQEEGLKNGLLEVLNLLTEQQGRDLLDDKLYPTADATTVPTTPVPSTSTIPATAMPTVEPGVSPTIVAAEQ